MTDRLTPAERSAHMARIPRAGTKPELMVRQMLHRLGYRFRVNLNGIPGRPDVAFPHRRKIIQVHGCFWHAHDGCTLHHVPINRREFWLAKFARNKERDARLESEARKQGWDSLIVWECEMKNQQALTHRLVEFLGPTRLLKRSYTEARR